MFRCKLRVVTDSLEEVTHIFDFLVLGRIKPCVHGDAFDTFFALVDVLYDILSEPSRPCKAGNACTVAAWYDTEKHVNE